MNHDMNDLKRCPFCGGEAKAIEAWNTRELVFSDGCRDPEVTGGWPDEPDTCEKLERKD